MKTYTGIGSRETPDDVLYVIEELAFKLAIKGWKVRTGGAPGADDAFARGARWVEPSSAELYLPWNDFEGWTWETFSVVRTAPQAEAFEIAAKYHPAWSRLSQGAKKLHARNVHQILGYDVTEPELTSFVLCWTKNGKPAGGTAQALRIAQDLNVPIYNLGSQTTLELFSDLV